MKYKKEQKLYCVYADDDGKCEMNIFIIRTIYKTFTYAIHKIKDVTWDKKSKKAGHYGWADSIPDIFREKVKTGEKFDNIYTTKKQAWKALIKRMNGRIGTYYEDDIREKILKTARRMAKKN